MESRFRRETHGSPFWRKKCGIAFLAGFFYIITFWRKIVLRNHIPEFFYGILFLARKLQNYVFGGKLFYGVIFFMGKFYRILFLTKKLRNYVFGRKLFYGVIFFTRKFYKVLYLAGRLRNCVIFCLLMINCQGAYTSELNIFK